MITYNWSIANTDRQTADNFIFTAHWRCSATDGDFSASVYGTCGFPAGTPVIPYANVTEAEVLGWCWANGVDKAATEASLAAQIDCQRNPTQASGVPWATTA